MRPDFFIIGAPNSGTTYLWELLRQHPQIFLPEEKEPRFFSKEDYASRWDFYESLFDGADGDQVVGEASVNYSETHIWPEVPRRIAREIPGAKLIYLVRHPIKRIESCWKQALSSGHWQKKFYVEDKMPLDFEKAVKEYPHLLGSTRYWSHLTAYNKHFSRDQLKVFFLKDFRDSPEKQLADCCEFLGVDSTFGFNGVYERKNAAENKTMTYPFISKIKDNVFLKKLGRIVPTRLKSYLAGKLYQKKVPQEVNWSKELKLWVLKQLKEDIKNILKHSGKKADFWKFEYELGDL